MILPIMSIVRIVHPLSRRESITITNVNAYVSAVALVLGLMKNFVSITV